MDREALRVEGSRLSHVTGQFDPFQATCGRPCSAAPCEIAIGV